VHDTASFDFSLQGGGAISPAMDQNIPHISAIVTGIPGGAYAPVPALPTSFVRSTTP